MLYFEEENDEENPKFFKIYAQFKGKVAKTLVGESKKTINIFCAAFKKKEHVYRWLDQQEVNPSTLIKYGLQNATLVYRSTKSQITEDDYASLQKYCNGKILGDDSLAVDAAIRNFASKSKTKEMSL